MKKYLEKTTTKYVIATLGSPTMYLKKTPAKNEYCFVEDIEIATKSMSNVTGDQILKYFYLDTGLDIELVVVPVEITYEIIDDEQG